MSGPKRPVAGGLVALARETLALPATLALVAAIVAMGASEAGYYPTTWYAAALFALALLVVAAVALPRLVAVPRTQLAAVGLLAAYAGWSYLSILWADEPALAWEGSNRSALYVLIFALASLWPVGPRGARILLGALGLGIAGVGLVELLRVNASDHPLLYFIDFRFAEPAGYINANVALWTEGMLPCLFLAAAREIAVPVRAVALGGAGLLGALSLMGQSRGWALALPLALVFYVAVGPGRVRKLGVVLVTAAATAAVSGPVLALHDHYRPGHFDGQLGDATRAVLLMTALLVVIGLGVALADRRTDIRPATLRRVRLGVGVAVTAAVCAGLIAVVVATGNPFERVSDAWTSFREGTPQAEQGASRFASAGTNRYEFWSGAFDLFEENPIGGIGADGFQPHYLERGKSGERPRFAHSLELGVLAQTGIVGAALLLGALIAAALAGIATLRRGGRERAAVAAAALAIAVYWLLHGSVDWFWEFPALAGAAWLALGTAGALAPRGGMATANGDATPADVGTDRASASPGAQPGDRDAADPAPRRGARPALAALLAIAAVLLAASFVAPWASELEIDAASDGWRDDPQAAFDRLDRARALNPLSARADLAAGTIALRQGRQDHAREAFDRALERDPHNAYASFELGLLAAGRGDRGAAVPLLEQALAASPRDDLTKQTLADVRAGHRVSSKRVNRLLLRRALERGAQGR